MAEYWNGTAWVGGVALWNGSAYVKWDMNLVPGGLFLPFTLPGTLAGGSSTARQSVGGSDGSQN